MPRGTSLVELRWTKPNSKALTAVTVGLEIVLTLRVPSTVWAACGHWPGAGTRRHPVDGTEVSDKCEMMRKRGPRFAPRYESIRPVLSSFAPRDFCVDSHKLF